MFGHLLELLLHAKAGTIAALFLIGTTGALVTATVENGVTTITLTEASPSPSASATATASPTASPSASPSASVSPSSSPSASPSSSPSSSASANPCSAQDHAAADAVKTVNTAFSGFHTDLEHMRGDNKGESARTIISNADGLLQQIRDNASKAIHATSTCAKNEDQDENDNDQNKDESKDENSGKHSQTNFVLAFFQKLFGKDTTVTIVTPSASPTASPAPTVAPSATPSASPSSGVTFTGTDPKAIADQAVAAMTLVFNDAKSKLGALPSASPKPNTPSKDRPFSPRPSKRPDATHGSERD